jgi:hypothetical protein
MRKHAARAMYDQLDDTLTSLTRQLRSAIAADARPPGRGAFHDFVLAAYLAKPVRTRCNGFRRTTRWQLRDPDAAVGRWYGEGGNTQNAMMRSLRTSPTSST